MLRKETGGSGGHLYGIEDMLSAEARAALDACLAEPAAMRTERLKELELLLSGGDAGRHTTDVLAVRVLHALSVCDAGDRFRSWELLREVFSDASELLGKEHEFALRVRAVGNVVADAAITESERNSRKLAHRAHHQLAADTARVLGPDHPVSVAARAAATAYDDSRGVHAKGGGTDAAAADAKPAERRSDRSDAERVFPSLEAFVSYVAEMFPIDLSRSVHAWCPDWWRHPEAVVRLSAMWNAFEQRSTEDPATGLERWYREADLHLAELRHPVSGTFSRCSPTHGHTDAMAALPTAPAPPAVLRGQPFSLHADDEAPEGPSLVFESLEEFVVLYIAGVFQSAPDDTESAWCPEWWRHGQAIARLTTLWRAYEAHHAEGSISDWLLYRADPQLRKLRAPDTGPFSRCSASLGHDDSLVAMPLNPPPVGFTCDERGTPMLIPPPLSES
ncbi:DUF4913 domain-containing protein [Yinghuangia sp. YIM S09857]|uniref:DUF4913 domain-containing protein n=1 Tax=Yinghuangia sp. YIM S09857 TaxID=3436929 RepID=UPI003F536EA5